MHCLDGWPSNRNRTHPCNDFFSKLLECPELDAEGGAAARRALLHKDFSSVIILDNPLGKAEAQSPAPLLRSEARPENILSVLCFNSFAGISHVDIHNLAGFLDVE